MGRYTKSTQSVGGVRWTAPGAAGICLLLAAAAAARSQGAGGNNATDYISWYVADLPAEFRAPHARLWGHDYLLGDLLPAEGDPSSPTWASNWEHIDYWFYNQMLVSPRRVHDPSGADVVVVPFGPHATQVNTTFRHFMERAHSLLPLLGKLPHILVLNLPAFMWVHSRA